MAQNPLDTPGALSGRITEYVAFRRSQGIAAGTLRNDIRTLRRFMAVNGNLLMKSIDDVHVTRYLEDAATTRGARSLQNDHRVLNGFFKWARATRRMPIASDPMAGRRAPRAMELERARVHVNEFSHLLDVAVHPRDRIVIALGLYLFLRSSEMKTLRLSRVGLDAGELHVDVWKSKIQDIMPICTELDEELRRWFEYYQWAAGKLKGEWFLIPAKTGMRWSQNKQTRLLEPSQDSVPRIYPTRPMGTVERVARVALGTIGFEIRDADTGKSKGEGIHTLRRSGGRALFDTLQRADPFVDETGEEQRPPSYPIRMVQAMLHHKHQETTERYIGLVEDRLDRDRWLRRRRMYTANQTNLVDLRSVR